MRKHFFGLFCTVTHSSSSVNFYVTINSKVSSNSFYNFIAIGMKSTCETLSTENQMSNFIAEGYLCGAAGGMGAGADTGVATTVIGSRGVVLKVLII